MRIAMHQPNFAPWCGYFAKMQSCDLFVICDDAKMPNSGYVNRSKIWNGVQERWLTVPITCSFASGDRIVDVGIASNPWKEKHLNIFNTAYGKAPHFKEVFELLEPIYADPGSILSDFNLRLIRAIAEYLGITCQFARTSEMNVSGQSDDRIINTCLALNATTYISGAGGQNYQDPLKFAQAGIELDVRTYKPISYPQISHEFRPGLSILDALFNLGRDTIQVLKYT